MVWAALACAAWPVFAAAPETFGQRLGSAQAAAGSDPSRARGLLAELRREAEQRQRLDQVLGVDEVDCRILSDLDAGQALQVADAGLKAAGSLPDEAARLPWLRLRACRAGVLIENGDRAAGEAELEQVLALSGTDGLRPAHALALLERGLARSRRRDLLTGQVDLLKACDLMKGERPNPDLDLCLVHLAKHHQRTGDYDEAMRLLTDLLGAARARDARFDVAIFTYGIGEVEFLRAAWSPALAAFDEAARLSAGIGDRVSQGYAERAAAATLRMLDRAPEGLARVERAISLVDESADPGHVLRSRLMRARLLAVVDRTDESNTELLALEAPVRAWNDNWYLAEWLKARSEALGRRGPWREAYQTLREWSDLEAKRHQLQLSEQAARSRMMFNRARDGEELDALRRLNEQGQQLRLTQSALLAVLAVLLGGLLVLGAGKFRQARRLQTLASTDELTGLPNRRALEAYADEVMRKLQPGRDRLSVLMVDVDHFKRVNDTHGHTIGDRALQHIARLLPAGLRGADRCARVGGEEFVVLLPGASMLHAAQIAQRMRDTISGTPLAAPAGPITLTVSIGVAEFVAASDSYATLVERADKALYQAKIAGRNAVAVSDLPGAPAPGAGRSA